MNVTSFKRWHWAAIGLIAGLLLGLGRVLSAGTELIGGPGYVDQATFESELRRVPTADTPRLIGLAVYPDEQVDQVRMTYLLPDAGSSRTVKFAAPRPYVRLNRSDASTHRTNVTVREYLAEVAAQTPIPPVRFAWWRIPSVIVAGGGLLGLVAIGGIWPTLLRRVIGAPPGDAEDDLAHAAGSADAALPAEAPAAEPPIDLDQDLVAALKGIAAAAPDNQPDSPAAARVLSDSPLPPPAAPPGPDAD